MQDEKSIEDQQRMCRERAQRDGLQITSEYEFVDRAVSGTLLRRTGLDKLRAAAERRLFDYLYFHSLSRLARESVISMPMLKELVYVHRVRVISLVEGLDTIYPNWEVTAQFACMHDEQYIKNLSANVYKGQVGTVLANFSVGDYRLGYTSTPSPGGEVIGRGRNAKPRMIYVIDQNQAEWVRRIFNWFAVEQQPLSWIVRELTRSQAPKDHRSTTAKWTRAAVIGTLRSSKNIGLWPWGRLKNVRNPLTGQVSQEERPDEETTPWLREFPELRIIDDATYVAAQELLDKNNEDFDRVRDSKGHLHGSPEGRGRNHLLAGLVQCGQCGSKLYVGGTHAKYLFCPGARDGICDCRTQLPRALAESKILDAIGERVLAIPEWREAVHGAMSEAWQQSIATRPDDEREVTRQIDECDRRIARLVDLVEDSITSAPELTQRLRERREERAVLARRLNQLEAAPAVSKAPPTREWVDEQLVHLSNAFRSATPAAAESLRNLLIGPIIVTEVRTAGRKRHYWQGRFAIPLGRVVAAVAPSLSDNTAVGVNESELTETITLDFRRVTKTELQGDRAWELYEAGHLMARIARDLDISKQRIGAILRAAAVKRGQQLGDGRTRRLQLNRKHTNTPVHEQIAEQAKQLADEGMLNQEIAEQLKVNRDTVTNALRTWHRAHNMKMIDGRTRRWQSGRPNLPK